MDAVQHFELPYKVRERAKKFYFSAFGWQLADVPGSGYSFASTVAVEKNGMPKRPGAINGGLTPRTKDLTSPTLLIRVGNLNAHLERVRHAGGDVLTEPTAMGPVWYARFRDPEGNVMGMIQPRPEGQENKAPAKKLARKSKAKAPSKPKTNPLLLIKAAQAKVALATEPTTMRPIKPTQVKRSTSSKASKPATKKSAAKKAKGRKATPPQPAAVWSR